ncbi:eukaryotic translation initiation factor 4E family member 1c isoform X1 [Siphateles boraxobius]|uniref:eukaryotic translation initiation factor 4E family member 1c isoform X1 n=1 Tax=Siphateles boraxobius TaxID=180520 RepID=UPI004063D78A
MATSEPRGTENEEVRAESPTAPVTSPVTSPEQYIKHPLQNRWALWYFKNDKSKSWTENLRLISKFDTVEDFWALYNHIQQPSKLGFGCDYCLFKDGIKPMWEDDRNKLGGRWLMTLSKQQRHNDLDRYWMETVCVFLFSFCGWLTVLCITSYCAYVLQLLCLIGESFDEASEDVCGAVVNVRPKGDKIAIWTGNCQNRDAIMTIGQQYKERLSIPSKTLIGYQSHDDTSSKSGSTTKNMYSV